MVIYNENNNYASAWLRNLSRSGHIAEGYVDDRCITELASNEIARATQFHAFAGVGVWSYALRLAGWPDDVPVWTGSCPCQPFSQAGKKKAEKDARHLWPEWLKLISECRPTVIFGEQVAGPLGGKWLDVVSHDLEALDYAVGAANLSAAGVGAPHVRQRFFWVGYAYGETVRRDTRTTSRKETSRDLERFKNRACGHRSSATVPTFPHPWVGVNWAQCSDGKTRPFKPGICPLANGNSDRLAKLRAYGNSIVPQVAAAFISSFLEVASCD